MKAHQTHNTKKNKFPSPFVEAYPDAYPQTYPDAYVSAYASSELSTQQDIPIDIFDADHLSRTTWHVHTQAARAYNGLGSDEMEIIDALLEDIEFQAGTILIGQNEYMASQDNASITITKAVDPQSDNTVSILIDGISIEWSFSFKEDEQGPQSTVGNLKNVQKDPSKEEIIYEKNEANKGEFNSTGYSFSWSDGHPLENREVTKFIYKMRAAKDPRFLEDFPLGKKGKEAPSYTISGSKYTYYAFDTGLDDPMTDDNNLQSDLLKETTELELAHDGKLVIGPVSPKGEYIMKIQQAFNRFHSLDFQWEPLDESGIYDVRTRTVVKQYQIDKKIAGGTNGVIGEETIRQIDEDLLKGFFININPAMILLPQQQAVLKQGDPKDFIGPRLRDSYGAETDWKATEYFEGLRVVSPGGAELSIAAGSVVVCNDKNQVEAFFINNKLVKGLFVYSDEKMTWVRTEDGATYFDLWEDAVMREQEPFSWGIHKAAHDFGGALVSFIDDPIAAIQGVWDAIKGLKNIDLDKTWERIQNADKTDAAYVLTTLFLAKVGSPKLPGAAAAAKTLFTGTLKYGEEIYQFLRKYDKLFIETISNSELYQALRAGASAKLGKALKLTGELGGEGFQAHHLIPMDLLQYPGQVGNFMRKAYDSLWEFNNKENGIWVKRFKKGTEIIEEEGVHANHPNYTARIATKIEEFIRDAHGKEISGPQAKAYLESLSSDLRELINEQSVNGTTKIDDLTF